MEQCRFVLEQKKTAEWHNNGILFIKYTTCQVFKIRIKT